MNKKKKLFQRLAEWLDAIFLLLGMGIMVFGTFLIYAPAGYILCGCCFIAMAIIYGKIRSRGDGS